MATFVIGDIHGYLTPLVKMLGQVRTHVVDGDTVVFLGDYIDRGPASSLCIDFILAFRDDVPANVVCLRGNHEDWLLRTKKDFHRHSWLLGMDGLTTVRSYSLDAEQTLRRAMYAAGAELYLGRCPLPYDVFFDALPPAHHQFLSELRLWVKTPDCICSHAGFNPQISDLRSQPADAFIWGDSTFPASYTGEDTVVYGHWDNAVVDVRGWPSPRIIGNTIGIDTISYGVLTAIRVPDRLVIQSTQSS